MPNADSVYLTRETEFSEKLKILTHKEKIEPKSCGLLGVWGIPQQRVFSAFLSLDGMPEKKMFPVSLM